MAELRLADGRRLFHVEYGDPAGRPALYCHGFPTSHHEARLVDAEARRQGLRVVAPDRPGYGASDPAALETVADWAADAEALLDALGWRRAALIGVSGGGPYALACGAQLPARVSAVVLVGALGPVAEPAMLAAMRRGARLGFHLARRAPGLLAGVFAGTRALLARRPALPFKGLSLVVPAVDRATLARAEVREVLAAGVLDALADGGHAAAGELGRYARPWGFALADIRCPVMLWHGLDDATVPVTHGRRLATALATAEVRLLPGEGHYSLAIERTGEIMAALATRLEGLEAGSGNGDTR